MIGSAPPRLEATELIDATGQDLGELAHSLRQVATVDRALGGERGVRAALAASGAVQARGPDGGATDRSPPTLLDVGAGNGAVVKRLSLWLADRIGTPVRTVAVDLHPDVVEVGRSETPDLSWVRADGLRLPLADDSVDIAVCTLTLHHFSEDGAIELLREMARVARSRVVVSDLERSRLHWLGARLLAATVWRGNRLTRSDGPTSVLRGWTLRELRELLTAAGLGEVGVRRHLPWRLVGIGVPPVRRSGHTGEHAGGHASGRAEGPPR